MARKIIEGHDAGGRAYQDFAVLYRTNAQSRVIEEIFMRNNIPYTIVGGLKFYERKEIKDILAYLRLISNPADGISLQRVINVPRRGLGDTSLARVLAYAAGKGISLFEAMAVAPVVPGLTARAVKPMEQFVELVEDLRLRSRELSVTDLVREVLDGTGYLRELEAEQSIEAETRIENLNEFLTVTAEYDKSQEEKSLEEFLSGVSLVADIDNFDERSDAVVLMTLHSAKGLEFPSVFLIGMEEGIFPHSRSLMEESELEEERRLCYVGITRAREVLHLLNAWQRTLYGNYMHNLPSRFIAEIPEHIVSREGTGLKNNAAAAPDAAGSRDGYVKQSMSASPRIEPRQAVVPGIFALGDKVEHNKWGQGVVVSVKGEDENAEISIAFPSQGIKTLIAKYAPIKKL